MKKTIRIIKVCVLLLLILASITACHQESIINSDNNDNPINNETGTVNSDDSIENNTSQANQNQHEHSYTEKNTSSAYLKSPATCTHSAIYYYSCNCGSKGSESFENGLKTEHKIVIDKAVEATCLSSGLTEGSHCEICSTNLQTQNVVPPKGHTIVIDEAVEATCLSSGLTEGSHCEICSTNLQTQNVVPPKGHTIVIDEAVEATCLSSGLTEGSHCEICSTNLQTQNVVPPKGHTIVIDEAVNATCSTSGLSEGSHCSSCNTTIIVQNTIPATGHNYSPATYTQPATCTKCGETTGGLLQQQPINITKPYLPTTQYGQYRITSCSYNTAWNGDGTYDVTVTFYFTNISSNTITGGVWATLSGIEPGDGTVKTLSPGSSGSCVVKFFNVDAGDYTITIE